MIITSSTSPIFNIRHCLPLSVNQALTRLDNTVLDKICEIRLHADGIASVTIEGKNYILTSSGISKDAKNSCIISSQDIEDFIYKFCQGSVYSHEETLSDFYITNNSVRVGIAGEAVFRNGTLQTVGKISSINIRIPRHIPYCSKEILDYVGSNGFRDGKGILIISSPGVGKTTLLRDLALRLSSVPSESGGLEMKRVCVIDERHEIYMDKIFAGCCIDFLSGIDKLKGLETASRVLSPEIIICDEIASPEEAEKITRRKNGGIIFIASIHADDVKAIMKKDYIKKMFDNGVFGCIYRLYREGNAVLGQITEYTEND